MEPKPENRHFEIDRKKIEFEYIAYDLYSGIQDYIQNKIRQISGELGRPALASPLITIIYELATNGLKAIYKQAFYTYAIHEVGFGDVPYEVWLNIFRNEMATNRAENFAHVCRSNNLSLRISAHLVDSYLRFEVVNDGIATDIERRRIQSLYERAKKEDNFESMLDDEADSKYREETGMGIPLIILTLKGLGIDLKNFRIILKDGRTVARVDIPLNIFFGSQSEKIVMHEDEVDVKNFLWDLYKTLNYSHISFSEDGLVREISGPILNMLDIPEDEASLFPSSIKAKFFEDIFIGPFSVRIMNRFENYRINISNRDGSHDWLFNVSGVRSPDNLVRTLWQPVNIGVEGGKLSEGSMLESLHVQKMISPYIPKMILDKAHESVRKGLQTLPNESKDVTILFADLIGFTQKSQSLPHNQVLDLLNLVLEVAVRSIEKNSGYIDKFIGDGIMTIFLEPLSAVVAAMEIQNNLFQLNMFREAGGADPIEMRIGINSGTVILGSIGTKKRMDWTALGDVVNTASRLEKLGRRNSVLVSRSTYDRVRDHVEVEDSFHKKIRGKDKEEELFFIRSVSFLSGERKARLELNTALEEIGVTTG